jgi:cytochrome c-type biogenesis protein CcmH/NrfF
MEGLANFTVVIYALAFLLVLVGVAAWWARRPKRNTTPGEPPTRYVDDNQDRIA